MLNLHDIPPPAELAWFEHEVRQERFGEEGGPCLYSCVQCMSEPSVNIRFKLGFSYVTVQPSSHCHACKKKKSFVCSFLWSHNISSLTMKNEGRLEKKEERADRESDLVCQGGNVLPSRVQHIPHTKDWAEGVLLWMVITAPDLFGCH